MLAIPRAQEIQLHLVNTPDIAAYCLQRFRNDPYSKRMGNKFCERLSTEIVTRSQGVFLWVYLVIKQILGVLRDGLEEEEAVIEALNQIPNDLDEYYAKLLNPNGKTKTAALTLKKIVAFRLP